MTLWKKLFLAAALLLAAGLGAVATAPAWRAGTGPVLVAHADGCDVHSPPPDLECPQLPTPTPKP